MYIPTVLNAANRTRKPSWKNTSVNAFVGKKKMIIYRVHKSIKLLVNSLLKQEFTYFAKNFERDKLTSERLIRKAIPKNKKTNIAKERELRSQNKQNV